ncbi:hypothetical protein KXD40_009702 [Peronospora effusa]|uniref:Uncharacterized protein n=1 Tax=Peronospora effusa TaxID=542832 RepID=A0A3M6VP64_9STRA|nr:hypothetical protein DD238_003495 [Peronospora effusa]UIZ23892.1 hypothetical protein KXD40_009702 [Peronospora effusa]
MYMPNKNGTIGIYKTQRAVMRSSKKTGQTSSKNTQAQDMIVQNDLILDVALAEVVNGLDTLRHSHASSHARHD